MAVVYKTSGKTLYEGQVVDVRIDSDTGGCPCWLVTVWDGETEQIKNVYTESEFYPQERPEVEVDAPPELMASYTAYKTAIAEKIFNSKEHRLIENGYTFEQFARLNRAYNPNVRELWQYGSEEFEVICNLLAQKTIRSPFRKSLKAQIDSWLATEEPQYSRPLSFKQCKALLNTSHRIY